MRIIPVIDLMGGIVVRGVGGRRSEYRPLVSQLTDSTDPGPVARALIDAVQPRELYLADLDAIAGSTPNYRVYNAILEIGVALWVDAGVRQAPEAIVLAANGCDVVAGLETIANAESLCAIADAIGVERLIFSYDLRDGQPLRQWDCDPLRVVADLGIRRVIVLDVANVGTDQLGQTRELCRRIQANHPGLKLFVGGGISGPEDVMELDRIGVAGVLVASALHDRRLRAADL